MNILAAKLDELEALFPSGDTGDEEIKALIHRMREQLIGKEKTTPKESRQR